jgi:putative transposase
MSGRRRQTPAQIIGKLREAEGLLNAGHPMSVVVQRMGLSMATYYRWRQKYGRMQVPQAKRLKDLEHENTRLKRLLAESELDRAILKEAIDLLGNP